MNLSHQDEIFFSYGYFIALLKKLPDLIVCLRNIILKFLILALKYGHQFDSKCN